METTIPASEFLPCYESDSKNLLRFNRCISIDCGVYPCKVKYLPFYEQMAAQLTVLIKKKVEKPFLKHFTFYFKTKAFSREGPVRFENKYEKELDYATFKYVEVVKTYKTNLYRGDFLRLHKNGFSYGCFSVIGKSSVYEVSDIWFRWKSNLPDYEYIEPDDELDLKPEDITFELCEQVPEEFALRFYAKTTAEYNCNAWINDLNEDCYYPKKRRSKKNRNEFPFSVSDTCEYPDTTFTLYFNEEITDELKDKAVEEFNDFSQKWDENHYYGIHSIMLADDLGEFYDENAIAELDASRAVKILVDFGSCEPSIIEKLIKWLQTSFLNIARVKIE